MQDPELEEEARAQAREILSEFAYSRVGHESEFGEFGQKSLHWIERFQAWVGGVAEAAPVAYWLLVAGLVLVLVALLVHMVWTWVRYRRTVASLPEVAGIQRAQDLRPVLGQAAAAAEAEGRYSDALSLHLRLALLQQLRKHPHLIRPGWTNSELLQLFADRPQQYAKLEQVVKLLDRTWYARRQCELAEYQEARQGLEVLAI